MAKWDVKDGFWQMCCKEGKEHNFAYVLPQAPGKSIKIVIPTLQMVWVEIPPYFCTALETARNIALDYTNMEVGTIPVHKFTQDT